MRNMGLWIVLWLSILVSESWAEILSGSDCDGKCRWEYDSMTRDLTFTANEGASGDLNIKNNYYRFYNSGGNAKNVTVGEGITSILQGSRNPFENVGGVGTTLSLPSTLRKIASYSSWGMSFDTIEIKSKNLLVEAKSIRNTPPSGVLNLVMPASEGIIFDDNAIDSCRGGSAILIPFKSTLNVQCKGAISVCEKSLAGVKSTIENNGGKFVVDYYKEYDSDGNVVLSYTDDGAVKYAKDGRVIAYYDLDMNLLETYDAGGNILRKYDNDGNIIYRRRIYTVSEAVRVVKSEKSNAFTFSMSYR